MIKKIHLARHYGFCMGVKRAIKIAEETARTASGTVTILNEIVHNEAVVQKFRDEGVGQSLNLHEINGGTVIISAHGVAPHVFTEAAELGLDVIDATCPLVSVIYDVVRDKVAQDYFVIHFGDRNHDETIGVVGHAPERITVIATEAELHALPAWTERKLVLTVQTTSSMEEFAGLQALAKEKWPHLEISDTICNATTQRQTAIREMAPMTDLILVVGSTTSANSKRLAQLAQELTGRGYLIGSALDIRREWFDDPAVGNVGISAGASTPDELVEAVIQKLVKYSGGTAEVIKPEKKRRRQEAAEEVH